MTGFFDILKLLGQLRKQRPLQVALIITVGLWIALAVMWPDKQPDTRETAALFVLATLGSYGGDWIFRLVRRHFGSVK